MIKHNTLNSSILALLFQTEMINDENNQNQHKKNEKIVKEFVLNNLEIFTKFYIYEITFLLILLESIRLIQ